MSKTTSKPKRKPGRPRRDLTPAIKTRICREVSLGKSLRRVLRAKTMPSMSKVMETLQEDRTFAEHYAGARRSGIGLLIDGIVDLADTATAENAHAVRLKVDVRKWIASKLVPKVYGDRVGLDLNGDGHINDDGPLNIIEAARRIAWTLRQGSEALQKERREAVLRLPREIELNPAPQTAPLDDDERPPLPQQGRDKKAISL